MSTWPDLPADHPFGPQNLPYGAFLTEDAPSARLGVRSGDQVLDLAGAVLPSRIAQGRLATVAVKEFVFKQPVFVGDLLSFYADIVKTGNTSVTVEVEVYAQRMSLTEDLVKVTEATLTYVATDSDRRPRALPVLD